MTSASPNQRLTDHRLTARVAGFIAHLRHNDFILGPGETRDALLVIAAGPSTTSEMRRRLKVLLTSRRPEWERFDGLFDTFWLPHTRNRRRLGEALGASLFSPNLASAANTGSPTQTETDEAVSNDGEDGGPSGAVALDSLTQVDFSDLADPREIAAAEQLAYRLASAIRHRLLRRKRAARRGTRLDLRRIIRASLAHGGDPLDLYHRRAPRRPMRIVVFLDVSGSMKPYSRFFLQFLKGLVCRSFDADAYLVHTRLVRVTDAVRERDPAKAMKRLSRLAKGFGGGTRLASSLRTFNDLHAKQALDSRTVVMIVSDGYDTGSDAALAAELVRINKRARRLVWLNPLLGRRDYRPTTLSMLAALPHVDHFAAANNLESLAAIEHDLARL